MRVSPGKLVAKAEATGSARTWLEKVARVSDCGVDGLAAGPAVEACRGKLSPRSEVVPARAWR